MKNTKYILVILVCLLLFSSCKKTKNTNGYISFTTTIQTRDKLISTVNELVIDTGKTREIWNHEYFSQYPLMVYDKQYNRVFYSQRTKNKQDELFVYDLEKKTITTNNTRVICHQLYSSHQSKYGIYSGRFSYKTSVNRFTLQCKFRQW